MASNTLSRREAIRQMLALPLALYAGTRHVNAQTPTPSPKISALEAATKKDPILKEKVYSAAENIKNATLNIAHEAYVPPISQPSDFDYHEGGMGVLLRPLNSRNTYFASCAHAWNFDLAEHGGIEKTIEAASRRGIVNPTREQIKERFKIAGYEVASQNMIGFDKRLDFSVLNVTEIMPQLEKVSTPLQIDLNEKLTHAAGDKVYWLPQSPNGSPFVEANILNTCRSESPIRKSGQPGQEEIETDMPISYECGKPVVSLYGSQPALSGIISGRVIDTLGGPLNRALFASANHIINAIRNYEFAN